MIGEIRRILETIQTREGPIVISGMAAIRRTYPDGRIRLTVDVNPESPVDRSLVMLMLSGRKVPVVLSRPLGESDIAADFESGRRQADAAGSTPPGSTEKRKPVASPSPEGAASPLYGEEASMLRRSGFFRSPRVWPLVGTVEAYCAWVGARPSVLSGAEDDVVVVRMGGAGESEYFRVPLTRKEAGDIRANGWLSAHPRDWWVRKRLDLLVEWCWETVKSHMGYAHWNEVPPHVFYRWVAESGGPVGLLPACYRNNQS